jgi:hypothetical protein
VPEANDASMRPALLAGFPGGLAAPNAPGLSMLSRGQGLNASWPGGQPLPDTAAMAASRRCADWRLPFMSSSCRASERDPVALVESCQRSLLWLLRSHQREPLRRCWIDHPYGEEEITRLEDELLPAMESFLARMDAIDQQLREAQEEQEAQVELERAAIAAAGAESSEVLVPF